MPTEPAAVSERNSVGVPVKRQDAPTDGEIIGARMLACELIRLAFEDAQATPKKNSLVTDLDKRNARAFLLDNHGDWRAARELWCAIADYDPDFIREMAFRRIAEVENNRT